MSWDNIDLTLDSFFASKKDISLAPWWEQNLEEDSREILEIFPSLNKKFRDLLSSAQSFSESSRKISSETKFSHGAYCDLFADEYHAIPKWNYYYDPYGEMFVDSGHCHRCGAYINSFQKHVMGHVGICSKCIDMILAEQEINITPITDEDLFDE